MNFPTDLKYTKEHLWVRQNKEEIEAGITEFAQSQLGDIVYVEVETEGKTIAQNQFFGTIEATKTVSDLFMPISGEVIAFNKALETNPEWVNTNPFDKAWIIKIKASNLIELDNLLSADEYKALVGE
ncbi:MAG: glycine cleavage system protein GcvH [Capnocytophaga sp.]|nr:glycine cleavage system protein GcvH [Capnocytophaga sp.]